MSREIVLYDSHLLKLLKDRGYAMQIIQKENSKHVSFTHPHAKENYHNACCYAADWSEGEIEMDCVKDLLAWSGLKVKFTLDY